MLQLKIGSRCPQNLKAVALRLLIVSITTCGLGKVESARSQITADDSLPILTQVNGSPTIPCTAVTCNITGGTPKGNTLFHSFEQFSPQARTRAIFINNDPAIENVISRVTGITASQIDGFIAARGSSPNFNLFLINPNGIIFGPNAALDLNGSFLATTASNIKFDNGAEFGINSGTPPMLSVNVPVGLQFGSNPGSIQVQGNGVLSPPLAVRAGNTLALVGGDVEIQDKSVITSRGRLEIGGVGANSFVNLNPSPAGFALDYSTVSDYQDVRLSQGARGLADSSQIQVRGRQVSLREGAALTAIPSTQNDLPGGNIDVYGSQLVEISGVSDAPSYSNSGLYAQNQGDSLDAGNITVTTPELQIRDGGIIVNSTSGTGVAGNTTINASRVELRGFPQIALTSFTGLRSTSSGTIIGAGKGGNVTVNAEQLIIGDGAGIIASTRGPGQAGNVTINNARVVKVSGMANGEPSLISTESIGAGMAGNLRIDTERFEIANGAEVRSTSEGAGLAGNIEVLNADLIDLNRGGTLLAEATGSGDAGTIRLQTRRLTINNAEIAVRSSGTGVAGNIDVDASIVELDNNATLSAENNTTGGGNITLGQLQRLNLDHQSEISAATVDGQGGMIQVNADWINLAHNSRILSTATGLGNGGNLVAIANRIDLNHQSQLSSATNFGLGGNLEISSRTLNLNNSTISAATQEGTGGTVSVQATEAIALNQSSRFLASATGRGTAGNLKLTTGTLTVQNDSQIATSSTGSGNAGSLYVSARQIELRDRALLTSETRDGIGGNITLRNWQTLSLDNRSQVSASTVNGHGGTLNLSGFGDLNLNNGSRLLANATGSGNAGNLNLDTAGKLSIENDSEIAVRNTGTGDAGNLAVNAADIFLSQRGRLAASTAVGNGGNIDLRVDNSIVLRFNSEISAEAGGMGNGGNIAINAGGFILGVLSENSDIVANAFQGNGGNITATALGVFNFRQFRQRRTPESDFIASSEIGIDGIVTINAQEQPQLEPLPDDFLNTRVAEGCDPLSRITNVGFYILGRRGLMPDPPFESLSSDGIWEDLRNPTESSSRSSRLGEPVVEAQGWIVNDRGNVVLVAEMPKSSGSHCAISLGL
jgi:filamentous hemagglutinin family protein